MKKVSAFGKILFAALVLASAVGCQRQRTLTIVSTNDMHAQIENFPRLSTLVDSLRATGSGDFLLIDAGDRWTGNPYVDRTNEPGRPIIELMRSIGYDISTYGNHEFDWGTELLGKRMAEFPVDKVVANADFSQTAMGATPPYKIIDVNGLKVAVLGLITVEPGVGHPVGKDASYAPATFTEPLAEAAKYSFLADSADLYIALTHIGFEQDSLLALQQPEIDLIIGGHSHTLIPTGRKINQTVVTQTERNLRYAGITHITFKGGKVIDIDNRVVKLDTIRPSEQYTYEVEQYYNAPEMIEAVGATTAPMDKTALMNLFSDAMRSEGYAEFAFHNMGGMRIDHLPEGKIARADVYSAEPFGNDIAIVYMTLPQIKALIMNKFNSTGKESHSIDLYPSGMTYKVERDANGDAKDVIIIHSQRPSVGNTYRVALSDYVKEQYDYEYTGGGKHDGHNIAKSVMSYLESRSPITPDTHNRTTIE